MTSLTIYPGNLPEHGERYTDFTDIQHQLDALGVLIERWKANWPLAADAYQSAVLIAYVDEIGRLMQRYDFQSVDVVKLTPNHPDKVTLRQRFLAEHIHKDFEVRFFVEGRGLFYLHVAGKVYAVLCEQGDLISVPANTMHWFDMGADPKFACIRLFTAADGWVADFTGSDIAKKFPTFDQYVAELS